MWFDLFRPCFDIEFFVVCAFDAGVGVFVVFVGVGVDIVVDFVGSDGVNIVVFAAVAIAKLNFVCVCVCW